ncbi:MAG: flagellar hook basal-body protein [Planctomycetes bacterium]|nr:flagellar hook basal-body protein [Planctomycetota bacterium]
MENASNNLANANTHGFKADLLTVMSRPVESETWLTPEQITRVEYRDELLDRMGGGVWLHQSHSILAEGPIDQTGNDFDFAVKGKGFFTMKDAFSGEVFFSRNGAFKVNNEGILQSTDGKYFVLDANGSEIDATQLMEENGNGPLVVDSQGRMSVNGIDTGTALGIKVFEGEDAYKLQKWGDNMFVAYDKEIVNNARNLLDLEGEEAVRSGVIQGALEGSGINPVEAAVNVIDVSRSYERHMNMMQLQNGTVQGLMQRVGRAI